MPRRRKCRGRRTRKSGWVTSPSEIHLLGFSGQGNASDDLYFSSGAGRLNVFGIGAFALRHLPGEVPTISRKLRLKAGWSVNPASNATVSKESFECNKRDFAASTRLESK